MTRRPLEDADYRNLARFRYALRRFLRFSEEAARGAGVTPSQHQLLLAVRGWDGGSAPSTSELAERLQLRLHSTVELVARAEGAGLVSSGNDGGDARRRLVRITDQGEAVLATLSQQHVDELRRFRTEMTDLLRELD